MYCNHYKFDRPWFYTSPELAWNAMVEKTGIVSELRLDWSILEFFGNQMRDGAFTIVHKYAGANSKSLSG